MNIFIFFIQTLEQIVNYLAVFDSWKVQLFVSLFTPEAAFQVTDFIQHHPASLPVLSRPRVKSAVFMYSETSDPRASDLHPNLRSQWVTTILVPTSSGSCFFILGISADLFLWFGFSFVCSFSIWLFM